jgi:hypothetical protein
MLSTAHSQIFLSNIKIKLTASDQVEISDHAIPKISVIVDTVL